MTSTMFIVFFVFLVLMALLSSGGEFVMRARVAKTDPKDKIAWWRRGGDEVVAAYQELFPHSHLPLLRRFTFLLTIVWAAAILVCIFWKSR